MISTMLKARTGKNLKFLFLSKKNSNFKNHINYLKRPIVIYIMTIMTLWFLINFAKSKNIRTLQKNIKKLEFFEKYQKTLFFELGTGAWFTEPTNRRFTWQGGLYTPWCFPYPSASPPLRGGRCAAAPRSGYNNKLLRSSAAAPRSGYYNWELGQFPILDIGFADR